MGRGDRRTAGIDATDPGGAAPGPAVAAHAGTRRGMIAVGRDADLVVLDRDRPVETPAAIDGSTAVATVVGGRVVPGEGVA
jgi:predicted amidohydrolase YtcJ